MWLTLLADAQAEQRLCGPAFVSDIAPAPNAIDVPTDSWIGFGFLGCDGPGRVQVVLSVLGTDGAFEAVQTTQLAASPGQVAWLVPDGGLLPDRDYRVETSGDSFATTSFRTGAGPGVPLVGTFAAELDSAGWSPRTGAQMGVWAFPADDPADLGAVELVDPDDSSVHLAGALVRNITEHWLVARWEARRPDEICVLARQIDGAGRLVGEEEICAEPERVRSSCSTAPQAPGWLAIVALAVGGRARRRR